MIVDKNLDLDLYTRLAHKSGCYCMLSLNRLERKRFAGARHIPSNHLHIASTSQAALLHRYPYDTLLSPVLHRCQHFSSTAELLRPSWTEYVYVYSFCMPVLQ